MPDDYDSVVGGGTFQTEVDVATPSRGHRKDRVRRVSVDQGPLTQYVEDEEFVFNPEGNELPDSVQIVDLVESVTRTMQATSAEQYREWKSLMLLKESKNVIQDSFWWILLDEFKSSGHESEQCVESKDMLEDRMAENYVYFLIKLKKKSSSSRARDAFLQRYPDAVAQSLYLTLHTSYPRSRPSFDKFFKRRLLHQTSLWINGLRPSKASLLHWAEDYDPHNTAGIGGGNLRSVKQRGARGSVTEPSPGAYTSIMARNAPDEDDADSSTKKSTLAYASRSIASTRYSLNHSPLVERFLSAQGCTDTSKRLAMKITLSEYPGERLADDGVCIKPSRNPRVFGKLRAKTCAHIVQDSRNLGKHLLSDHKKRRNALKREVALARSKGREEIEKLEKKREEIIQGNIREYSTLLVAELEEARKRKYFIKTTSSGSD